MADDFGDYSGEKLFDWILRIARRRRRVKASAAADSLAGGAINARKGAGAQGREAAGMEACGREAGGTAEWAKLDMHEFTSIEDWPTLQDIIDGKLDDCGIAHDWHKEAQGKTYLLFRAEDAPSLVRAFDEMSRAVDAAKEKASAELAAEFARARERARDLGKDHAHGRSCEDRREREARRQGRDGQGRRRGAAQERPRGSR